MVRSILFWQPSKDILPFFLKTKLSRIVLVILNYLIWVYYFYVSYLLIRSDINFFGQLFIATFIAELVERFIKNKRLWTRPLFNRSHKTPPGLVDSWYKTGSFPSGHTIKATFFFLFILANPVISPTSFLIITIPLLAFRVLVGFHYLIDMIGGLLIGLLIWILSRNLMMPDQLNTVLSSVFNFVFFIR